jgi:hypothetical protein
MNDVFIIGKQRIMTHISSWDIAPGLGSDASTAKSRRHGILRRVATGACGVSAAVAATIIGLVPASSGAWSASAASVSGGPALAVTLSLPAPPPPRLVICPQTGSCHGPIPVN